MLQQRRHGWSGILETVRIFPGNFGKAIHIIGGNSWKRNIFPLLLLACMLALSACGESQLPPEAEEGVLIYACMNPQDRTIRAYVNSFNSSHEDVQIEVRDYSGEEGAQRLLVELTAGRIPDIMDLHYFGKDGQKIWGHDTPVSADLPADEYWMPYRQLVQKGYLENLWPYIENDSELGRDAVLLPPLEAAEVNGGLYMLFQKVRINTLMGAEHVVGERYGWTFEELTEVFATMPEDSTILRYNATTQDVFFKLLRFSLDQYVNWETGECFFDGEEFCNMLAFLKCFPAESKTSEDAIEEVLWRIQTGRQMLEGIQITWPSELMYCNALWRGRASFVGYPTANGRSGSFFYPQGSVLAMSSACRDKDAAWDFMRKLIRQHYNVNSVLHVGPFISVNLYDYEVLIRAELQRADDVRDDFSSSLPAMMPWHHFSDKPDIYPTAPISEEDIQRYEALIYNTTQLYWPDDALSDIVWDAIGPYLAGDKTLDETVQLLNNRVMLYVNEQR